MTPSLSLSSQRRSPNASFSPKFVLHTNATGAQLAELEARVRSYVRAHPLDWKPGATMTPSLK